MTKIPNLSPCLSLWHWNIHVSFFNPFGFSILAYFYLFNFSIFGILFFFLWFLNAAQVFEEMLKLKFGLDVQ